MRRYGQLIISLLCLTALCGCEDTSTFRSSVPMYPVRLTINTQLGSFVHFQPTALNSFIVVNRNGYFMDNKYVLPVSATDAWGYGGVVVYVSTAGYVAYDLACPYCAARSLCSPCSIDGFYATCPKCGEQYELASGLAMPQKGISKEAMRKLNINRMDGVLTVTQRQ